MQQQEEQEKRKIHIGRSAENQIYQGLSLRCGNACFVLGLGLSRISPFHLSRNDEYLHRKKIHIMTKLNGKLNESQGSCLLLKYVRPLLFGGLSTFCLPLLLEEIYYIENIHYKRSLIECFITVQLSELESWCRVA